MANFWQTILGQRGKNFSEQKVSPCKKENISLRITIPPEIGAFSFSC
jgi:hypothetical protein